jgi:hypothetical protein
LVVSVLPGVFEYVTMKNRTVSNVDCGVVVVSVVDIDGEGGEVDSNMIGIVG